MKKTTLGIVLVFVIALVSSTVFSEEKGKDVKQVGKNELVAQTVCPVMGGAIDSTVFADHQGQRVYFCCASCIDQFKADPEKYFKMADEGRIRFHNIQTVCPVSGDPVDKEHFRYFKGRGIFFCGEECAKRFDSEPDKYLEEMEGGMKKKESPHKHKGGEKGHDHKH